MGWLRVNYYNIIGPPLQHPQGSRGLDHFGGRQPYLSLGLLLHVHVIFNKREREREREREGFSNFVESYIFKQVDMICYVLLLLLHMMKVQYSSTSSSSIISSLIIAYNIKSKRDSMA